MTVWPRFLRQRWEQREREADDAGRRLEEAKAEHARVLRLAAESRRIKRTNGFTEAILRSMGVHQ